MLYTFQPSIWLLVVIPHQKVGLWTMNSYIPRFKTTWASSNSINLTNGCQKIVNSCCPLPPWFMYASTKRNYFREVLLSRWCVILSLGVLVKYRFWLSSFEKGSIPQPEAGPAVLCVAGQHPLSSVGSVICCYQGNMGPSILFVARSGEWKGHWFSWLATESMKFPEATNFLWPEICFLFLPSHINSNCNIECMDINMNFLGFF